MNKRRCPNCKWEGTETDTKSSAKFCPVCGDNTEIVGSIIEPAMDLNGDGIEDVQDVKKASKVMSKLGKKLKGGKR
jgi:hypothetical protein